MTISNIVEKSIFLIDFHNVGYTGECSFLWHNANTIGKRGGAKMNLTRYEQEVVINLNAEEDVATIYSSNPVWLRKMETLASEFPDVFLLIRQSGISKTYSFPKRLLRIGKPRELSSAQRENLAKMRESKRKFYDENSHCVEPENTMNQDDE